MLEMLSSVSCSFLLEAKGVTMVDFHSEVYNPAVA